MQQLKQLFSRACELSERGKKCNVDLNELTAIRDEFRALEQRAEAAEAKLAGLEKQEPVAVIARREPTLLWEWTKQGKSIDRPDGMHLYARRAPAINLAELVPDESDLADRHIAWLNTLQRPMFSDEDWEELTLYTWLAFRDSYRVHKDAIMRNFEEHK